jgi:tRNA-specific 2-thiouridylase
MPVSKKVFVAMSGGVDSSTAAALLLKEKLDCAGLFMITNNDSHQAQKDAEKVCRKLGIEFYVVDFRDDFEEIISYLCDEYAAGRTPNPCVHCNKVIKFDKLWKYAKANGGRFIATGHYAQIMESGGQSGLYEAKEATKDQSYVLSMIDRKMLDCIILPMGPYDKHAVRKLAGEFELGIEDKEDSQEICFLPDGDYARLVERRRPGIARSGKIVDTSGNFLGEHSGVHHYTIGQRRGLGVALGQPAYVVKIDLPTNTVTLGSKEYLLSKKLRATSVNWLIDKPSGSFRAKVKIRYNHAGQMGEVVPEGNSVIVEFEEPVSAITPGQAAVFYIPENRCWRVAGGAWIDRVGHN